MADTREPSPRSRRTKQGSEIPSKKTQAEIDAAKEGAKKARKIIEEGGNVKLSEKLKIEKMDPRMRESYERNKGNPEFNREMEAFRRGKKNLTNEEIIDRLNKNKQILQIGKTIYQTGRNALAIGNGLWQFSRALSGFK